MSMRSRETVRCGNQNELPESPSEWMKMNHIKTLLIFSLLGASQMVWAAPSQAGPLLDWLFNRNRCYPQCQTYQPPAATCQTTCQQTCSRVVVNYVPYTAYRTSWERIPVTTYRRTQSTDPCTGCTVTCNRPCTTYTYRMKQVPYTTHRPVYRTETYRVPVTYTTQMAAPVASGCSTCASGFQPAQVPANNYYNPAAQPGYPVGTPTTGQPTPADLQPQIPAATNSAYRAPPALSTPTFTPLADPNPSNRWNSPTAPPLLNSPDRTTQAPSVQRWAYSPVRLASHQNVYEATPRAVTPNQTYTVHPTRREVTGTRSTATNSNEVWRSAN